MTTSDAFERAPPAGGADRHGRCSAAPRRSAAADPGGPDRRRADRRVISATRPRKFVPLGVGKSVVVDLPGDIKDVLVADPKIANAVVRTSRRAYIIGVAVGQTNVYLLRRRRPADRWASTSR